MPAGNPPASSGQHRGIWAGAALATVVHVLRDRRTQARLISWGIALAALGRLGRDNQQRTLARLAAWDRRVTGRLQRETQHYRREISDQAREIEHHGREIEG
jgi:hypothetical protein